MTPKAWQLPAGASPVFRGAPPLLVADIEIDNPGDRHVRPGKVLARLEGDERDYLIRIPGRLQPETKTRLHAHLIVDSSMAPGTYQASMLTQDGERPVELRVFERKSIVAIPSSIEFAGAAGAEVEADLFLENKGNVAFAIHSAGSVFFEEVDWVGRALVFAMRETGPDEGFARYQDRVFEELRTTMQHKTTVAIKASAKRLAPGASVEAKISMTLPTGLYKGRNYAAFFDIAGTRLRLGLACTGSAASPKRRPR